MKNNAVRVVEETRDPQIVTPEVVEVITFDKDVMYQDLTDGLKQFGVGCCEAGKETLAPLASTMLKHFFNWVICKALQ